MAVINHRNAIAYAATALGAPMMSAVFNFYYVKIFLNHYHVSVWWFQVSQVIFLVWNAINDPLFGYMQDNMRWMRRRRLCILYGAPFYAIAFIMPWFPWGDYEAMPWLGGLHLLFTLCFWDTLFTFVLLAHCALFAEISKNQTARIKLIRYSQISSLIGTSSVFITGYASSNLENYFMFQVTCILIAICSWYCMRYTGLYCTTEYDDQTTESNKHLQNDVETGVQQRIDASFSAMWRQTVQIFKQPSFLAFVVTNFFHQYHRTFLSNFMAIIHEQLISNDVISTSFRSMLYGSFYILPKVSITNQLSISVQCV